MHLTQVGAPPYSHPFRMTLRIIGHQTNKLGTYQLRRQPLCSEPLQAFSKHLYNARVDVLVDNQAVLNAWNNQGGKSLNVNTVLKELFFLPFSST